MAFFEKFFRPSKKEAVEQKVTKQEIANEDEQRRQATTELLSELRAKDSDPQRQQRIGRDAMRLSEAAQEELDAIAVHLAAISQYIEEHGPRVHKHIAEHPEEFSQEKKPWLGVVEDTGDGAQLTFTFYGSDANTGEPKAIENERFSISRTVPESADESAQRRIQRGTDLWRRTLRLGANDIGHRAGFEVWGGV